MMQYCETSSPVGTLLLAGDEQGLRILNFQDAPHPLKPGKEWRRSQKAFHEAVAQLEAYFAGRLRAFDLPLAPQGTAFQLQVWQALRTIPYGETLSYSGLAQRIGKPAAVRAVGAANGRNPIAIIIPCHRVIGADGSLTGFGGGLPVKRTLLALEGALPDGGQLGLFSPNARAKIAARPADQ
jgi:methylated-DNA-[protein]-cysteine S-methyltransferase